MSGLPIPSIEHDHHASGVFQAQCASSTADGAINGVFCDRLAVVASDAVRVINFIGVRSLIKHHDA